MLYEAHDYKRIGEIVDRVIIMTYEWGYTYGPAMAVAPLHLVRKVVEYAIQEINPEKINLGIPTYGYDFTLPFKKGQKAKSLSYEDALALAYKEKLKFILKKIPKHLISSIIKRIRSILSIMKTEEALQKRLI